MLCLSFPIIFQLSVELIIFTLIFFSLVACHFDCSIFSSSLLASGGELLDLSLTYTSSSIDSRSIDLIWGSILHEFPRNVQIRGHPTTLYVGSFFFFDLCFFCFELLTFVPFFHFLRLRDGLTIEGELLHDAFMYASQLHYNTLIPALRPCDISLFP